MVALKERKSEREVMPVDLTSEICGLLWTEALVNCTELTVLHAPCEQ